jgi:arginase family enzyme
LTLDLDAIDPAFAPGVSHPEPGGLTVRDAIRVVHSLRGRLVGADLVEYNPRNDPVGATAVVCGKLVKEMIGAMASSRVQ